MYIYIVLARSSCYDSQKANGPHKIVIATIQYLSEMVG